MRGATLVELMVVLFVLGVMAAVSGFAVAGLRAPAQTDRDQMLSEAQARAIRSGKAVTITPEGGASVRFLPDGRAIGAGVDPLTGQVLDARR